jgi:hypothetical protein
MFPNKNPEIEVSESTIAYFEQKEKRRIVIGSLIIALIYSLFVSERHFVFIFYVSSVIGRMLALLLFPAIIALCLSLFKMKWHYAFGVSFIIFILLNFLGRME